MSDVKKLSQLEYFIALTQWTSFRWANERNVFLSTLKQTPNKWTRAWDKHRHSILIFQIRILFSTLIPSFLFTYHRSLRMCLWIVFTVNYYYSLLFVFFELCRSCRWAKNITAYWIDGMKLCRSTQSTDERKRMNQREYERFYVWLTATSTYGCVSTFKVAMEYEPVCLFGPKTFHWSLGGIFVPKNAAGKLIHFKWMKFTQNGSFFLLSINQCDS